MWDALASARESLSAIGAALGPGREVVIVPGNHDHQLAAPWFERRARDGAPVALGLENAVDWRDAEPLAEIVDWLSPADVRVAYPGVWLRDDVYATHGHYCDRHTTVPMFERLGAGAMARIMRESSGGPQRAEDYEATLTPIYAWLHAIAQNRGPALASSSHGASARAWQALAGRGVRRSIRRRAMIAAFPLLVTALNRARLGPLQTDLSGSELRRAALRAFGEVLVRLRVDAAHVIFGHTHRAGPLARDQPSEWLVPTGARILNTGSWVHEPGFIGNVPHESPYRPGFCVQVGDRDRPQLRNLLD